MRRRSKVIDRALSSLRSHRTSVDDRSMLDALETIERAVLRPRGLDVRPVSQRDALFDALARIARDAARSVDVRIASVQALRGFFDRRSIRVFARLLADRSQPASLRAECAEAIGFSASAYARPDGRWTVGDRLLDRAVLDALHLAVEDEDPSVRFWAVYAIGSLRDGSFEPTLTRLAATDHAHVPSFWTVAEEASDVLEVLRGGEWPRRASRPHE
jgi:HEAT repeat protein